MAYATLTELKGFVGIPAADTADDTTLTLALDSASEQVDHHCDRTFPDAEFVAVPASVKQATLVQASRLWKRKDAPFGVAGSVEFGSELRLLAKLDPDVEKLLRPYRRFWWAL